MENQTVILILTAASLGFLHTLLGPDHYIPFVAMAKAGRWSKMKTIWITILSGMGHVFSSVVIGIIGIAAGLALNKIKYIELFRAEFAAWFIISFGLIYLIWGLKRAYHDNHEHMHTHGNSGKMTPWIIFTIFVLGPCEPLIPLLIYPAVMESISTMISVIIVFTLATTLTMVFLVNGILYGLKFIPVNLSGKYSHAIAGFLILICGVSIKFLGL